MSSLPNHIIPSIFGLLAGALTKSVLSRGLFGGYDIAMRPIVVGAVAGIVTLSGVTLNQKWNPKP